MTPNTCHVLDDGFERIIGYCVGTADTVAFAQRWRDTWIHGINDKQVTEPDNKIDDLSKNHEMVEGLGNALYNARCGML